MGFLEVDMVVKDALAAVDFYEKIFTVEVIEKTDLKKGGNEAVLMIENVRFHLLDENPEYQLFAPQAGTSGSTWFNVIIDLAQEALDQAVANGATVMQELTDMPAMGAKMAMFQDPFGYTWMVHEVYREVSSEEREQHFKDEGWE